MHNGRTQVGEKQQGGAECEVDNRRISTLVVTSAPDGTPRLEAAAVESEAAKSVANAVLASTGVRVAEPMSESGDSESEEFEPRGSMDYPKEPVMDYKSHASPPMIDNEEFVVTYEDLYRGGALGNKYQFWNFELPYGGCFSQSVFGGSVSSSFFGGSCFA